MRLHPDVQRLEKACVRHRQALHRIPETCFAEHKTQAYILRQLQKCAPDRLETLAQTGVKAVYFAPDARGTLAFRADTDGLGLVEETGAPYASVHAGRMHGCGHDGHMTMLLLLARLVHKRRAELRHNVVLLFQPAEEGRGGARTMIQEGALSDPPVDCIYGMHVWPSVPRGKIGVRWGPMMARTSEFDVIVHGKSAHGASPQMGVDAVVAAAELISLMQTAISRSVDPHQDALLTIGKISGGTARNIIADRVELNATLRVFSGEVFEQLAQRLRAMLSGLEVATGARFEFRPLMHYPCVNNPRPLVEEFYTCMAPEELYLCDPVMAAEDFAFYQQEIPGLFLFLGVEGGKNAQPLHNSRFDFDEALLLNGVEVYRRLLGLGGAPESA
ncbi:MAG: M20 family metallopeptidase [Clostridia bacterium]|nr:M20 family metallopeptidase [Clostridia bacterium]